MPNDPIMPGFMMPPRKSAYGPSAVPGASAPPPPPSTGMVPTRMSIPGGITMEHPLIKQSIPTYDTIPPSAQQMLSETVMKDYKGDADPMQVLLDPKSYLYAKKKGLLPDTYPDTLEELMMQSASTTATAESTKK